MEPEVCIGDRLRCGTAELTVTQPRVPCPKLAFKLGDRGVLRHMLTTGHTGFYLAIRREGQLMAGDEIELIERPEGAKPVSDLTTAYAAKSPPVDLLRALIDAPGMTEDWLPWLRARLAASQGS